MRPPAAGQPGRHKRGKRRRPVAYPRLSRRRSYGRESARAVQSALVRRALFERAVAAEPRPSAPCMMRRPGMTNAGVPTPGVRATGSCLCGAVRYEVDRRAARRRRMSLRDVPQDARPHRRLHGDAEGRVARSREARGLRWYASSANARRGFCGECGGSLFFEPLDQGLHGDRRRHARCADRVEDRRADPRRRAPATTTAIDESIRQRPG